MLDSEDTIVHLSTIEWVRQLLIISRHPDALHSGSSRGFYCLWHMKPLDLYHWDTKSAQEYRVDEFAAIWQELLHSADPTIAQPAMNHLRMLAKAVWQCLGATAMHEIGHATANHSIL